MKTSVAYMDEEKLSRLGDQISEVLYDIDRESLISGQIIDRAVQECDSSKQIVDKETDSVQEMTSDDLLEFISENDVSDLEKISLQTGADEEEPEHCVPNIEPLSSVEKVADLTRLMGFELLISKDRLRCYANIDQMYYECPPKATSIINMMLKAGVIYGVESIEAISQKITEIVNTGAGPFIVAIGTPPKKGKNASIKFNHDFSNKNKIISDENKNIDHHETGIHTRSVAVGEILATVTPPGKGKAGIDIFNQEIPGHNGREAPIRVGKNVSRDASGLKYFATAPGQVIMALDELSVIPVLNIEGDIDYSVGNIEFKGSVRIKGSVRDGFRIKVGGDVYIGKNVEGAFIECGGDLVVRGGIVGRGIADISCTGTLKTTFIENADVSAEGNIIVSKGIVHSDVISNGSVIITEKKGKIVGGRVISRNLVEADSIGSQMEVKTEICVGRDAGIQKMLWDAAEKKRLLENHLVKIQQLEVKTKSIIDSGQRIPENLRTSVQKAIERKHKILAAIQIITKDEKRYRANVAKDIPGRIKVESFIYPNTRVEIGFSKKHYFESASHLLLAEDKNKEEIIQLDLF